VSVKLAIGLQKHDEVLCFSRFLLAGPVILYHRRCGFLQNSAIGWDLRFRFVEFARLMFDRMPKQGSIR
jgi:hypothetical protein